MGRRPGGWYPNQFIDLLEQQAKRPIAAAPSSMVSADEYPPLTTVPSPTNLGRSTSAPRRPRSATPGPSGVSKTKSNKSKVKRPRPNENLSMHMHQPQSPGQPNHDTEVPRSLERLYEPMIEEQHPAQPRTVLGLDFMTVNNPEDLKSILGQQQHPCLAGDVVCRGCFDLAMLESGVDMHYTPGQHNLPLDEHGPTPTASDSSLTMPPYQPLPGTDDGQGNDETQSTTPGLYDDGMQSTSQQPRDDGQGNDGMQPTSQWP